MSSRSQGLGSRLCDVAQVAQFSCPFELDYCCVVYDSARQSVLECLDRVQNAALCTCLGAFRTSLVSSLHVEASELPFNCDFSNCVYNISVNFDQIHATLFLVLYLALASDAYLMLDQKYFPLTWYQNESKHA